MEEVVAGIFKFIGRAIVQIFIELILEILIKGPGYLIIKFFSNLNEKEPTENKIIITGILFWCLVGGSTYLVFKYGM